MKNLRKEWEAYATFAQPKEIHVIHATTNAGINVKGHTHENANAYVEVYRSSESQTEEDAVSNVTSDIAVSLECQQLYQNSANIAGIGLDLLAVGSKQNVLVTCVPNGDSNSYVDQQT